MDRLDRLAGRPGKASLLPLCFHLRLSLLSSCLIIPKKDFLEVSECCERTTNRYMRRKMGRKEKEEEQEEEEEGRRRRRRRRKTRRRSKGVYVWSNLWPRIKNKT